MTAHKTNNYHAYLLRFWRDDEQAPWRATLQDPHTGRIYGFPTMQQLYQFLEGQTENKPEDGHPSPK